MNNLKEQNKSSSQRIKKLAAFGCSWTDWHTIGRYENQPNKSWPEYLGELLKCDVYNGGRGQLNNNLIAQNLMMYIAKGNKPDAVIFQTTEWERITARNFRFVNKFKYGELASGRQDEPQWFRYKRHDAGEEHRHLRWHMLNEHTAPHQESGIATMVFVQTFCETHNIPVYFLNFFPIGDAVDSPISKYLKTSNIIVDNYRNGGWYNHLQWCAFKGIDAAHFGIEAQQYTAEMLARFLQEGVKPVVEEESWAKLHNRTTALFNYTN